MQLAVLLSISECLGSKEKWSKARQMLKELKDNLMTDVLPKDKILTYHVNWNERGGNNVEMFSWKNKCSM